jgi:CDP-diacylglycerol--serine O-phosphatidyltransferase
MRLLGFYDYTVILTYMSLLSAFAGMILSGKGMHTAAVLCLMFCGICDAFDGTVARTKKNRTEDEKAFGIQIDSLCDAVSFGVFPALLSVRMGLNGILGMAIAAIYSLCAVIRLAFFNVQEAKRQQAEEGKRKTYRGLPVTSISMIYPVIALLQLFLPAGAFRVVLHIVMAATAFAFVLDFSVKKPDFDKLLTKHT